MPAPHIYLAFASPDEIIAREVEKKLQKKGWTVVSARNLRGYKQKIGEFIPLSERFDAVIMLISKSYVHDEYCMYELLELHKQHDLRQHIFPLPVDQLNLADSQVRLELVKYWETQYLTLEDEIRDLDSLANIEGLTRDLNRYNAIRMQVADLTQLLKDMNLLDLNLHKSGDYSDLIQAIERSLINPLVMTPPAGPVHQESVNPAAEPTLSTVPTLSSRRNWWWLAAGLGLILVLCLVLKFLSR